MHREKHNNTNYNNDNYNNNINENNILNVTFSIFCVHLFNKKYLKFYLFHFLGILYASCELAILNKLYIITIFKLICM